MDEWIKKWGRKSDQQREESMRLMIHEYGEYFLQQDLNEDESAMTIMLNIAKWGTKSTNRLYFLPKYRYYYPLLSLTCEIAILPLRILILTSFDQIVLKNEDYDFLNIVTTHTRFQEVKDLIYKVDYLLYDKLDFDAEFCYGAIFSEDSLQAAVFISRENIYIYHSPQSSLNSNQLHILIITVINDWLSNHQLSSLFGVVKVSDDVLANTLQNIGFRSPHGNDENIFDELIVFPSSDVPGAASTTPEEIFLLMGQSNMSGRGSLLGPTGLISTASECSNLHEVVQNVQRQLDSLSDVNCHKDIFYAKEGGLEIRYSEHYDERIQTFDIQSKQWRRVENVFQLHKEVDILKTVGLGPGITFASRYLDLNQNVSQIGLIPLSVGATSIVEWLPSYRPKDQPKSFLCSPSNAYLNSTLSFSNFMIPGFYNLFSCTMKSIYLSMFSILSKPTHPIHSIVNQSDRLVLIRQVLGGVLWYQGCNDAIPSIDTNFPSPSSLYAERLQCFFHDIRKYIDWICLHIDLTLFATDYCSTQAIQFITQIPLRTVLVAITTTRPWLSHTSEIRSIQTSATSFSTPQMPIVVVDAFGSILQSDCIHLSTHSYYRLGCLLADAMKSFGETSTVKSMDSILLTSCHQHFIDFYFLLRSLAEDTLERHYSTHKEALYPLSTFRSHLPSPPSGITEMKSLPILQTGLKPINFVYGEISFSSLFSIIYEIIRIDSFHFPLSMTAGNLFVDLGCGSCLSLVVAYFIGKFDHIIGVDMMRSKLEIGATIQSLLHSYLLSPTSPTWRSDASFSPHQQHEIQQFFQKYASPFPLELNPLNISIREGNFLQWENLSESEWRAIKVLYICSTCYHEDDLLKQLYEDKFPYLSIGSYVILLDKQLPQSLLLISMEDQSKSSFQLLFSRQCKTTWGVASAYIYRCMRSGS